MIESMSRGASSCATHGVVDPLCGRRGVGRQLGQGVKSWLGVYL